MPAPAWRNQFFNTQTTFRRLLNNRCSVEQKISFACRNTRLRQSPVKLVSFLKHRQSRPRFSSAYSRNCCFLPWGYRNHRHWPSLRSSPTCYSRNCCYSYLPPFGYRSRPCLSPERREREQLYTFARFSNSLQLRHRRRRAAEQGRSHDGVSDGSRHHASHHLADVLVPQVLRSRISDLVVTEEDYCGQELSSCQEASGLFSCFRGRKGTAGRGVLVRSCPLASEGGSRASSSEGPSTETEMIQTGLLGR